MSHLAPLISDLALILVCAGIMTLIFKKLKQPLVLGYIVAGFIASPHFRLTPSVTDIDSIKTWSDIGVIFLLFALGLDFSFKKLMKMGSSVMISACTIIFFMIMVGILVGWSFGWNKMDCIYLGGMLAMSSTTIIYKAFDDLGLRQQNFAGLVLSILIIEDILAIVLMVMLSTMAVSSNFEGSEMVASILKLIFFLILWFVVGLYLIPTFLKRYRKLMNNETLLIFSLGLCFGMVVIAAKVGFSPAFGAFIMGSILSETLDSEQIEKLVSPVKDLFGAIFFVSVGMMVEPELIVKYSIPILVIVFAIITGQTIFGTLSVLLSGQSLKTSMQCGFSLTQIGEFAFIIASLGVSLGVTSDFLYPIVVTVSVITTFLTPYMIRVSLPSYNFISRKIPSRWMNLIDSYSGAAQIASSQSNWKALMNAIVRIVVVYSVLSVAGIALCLNVISPFIIETMGYTWGPFVSAAITIIAIAPFLRALIMKKNHSIEFRALWSGNKGNHIPLVSVILLRVVIAVMFVMYVIKSIFQASVALVVGVAIIAVLVMILSRFLKRQSILLERTFVRNLKTKDMLKVYKGEKKPDYAVKLLDRDMHISDFKISSDSLWSGMTLQELDLGRKFGVHVASIIRGMHRINIPGGYTRLFPGDTLHVIGTDSQLDEFTNHINAVSEGYVDDDFEKRDMLLRQFVVTDECKFIGKSIRDSGIRNKYHCMVVGVESVGDVSLHTPDIDIPFEEGDIVWVVGEESSLKSLMDKDRL